MKSIAPQLAVYELVAMVENLQAFGRADGEVQKREQRNSACVLELLKVPSVVLVRDFICIGAERNQILKIVWAWRFEDACDERLGIPWLGRKSDEFDRTDEMATFRVGLLDYELAKLEFAL